METMFERLPLTRARLYPPAVGDDLPDPETLGVTALAVDFDVETFGTVTLSAENPRKHDGRGVELDLLPDDARRLATALIGAADAAEAQTLVHDSAVSMALDL